MLETLEETRETQRWKYYRNCWAPPLVSNIITDYTDGSGYTSVWCVSCYLAVFALSFRNDTVNCCQLVMSLQVESSLFARGKYRYIFMVTLGVLQKMAACSSLRGSLRVQSKRWEGHLAFLVSIILSKWTQSEKNLGCLLFLYLWS